MMRWARPMKALGILIALLGVALAIYSFPFVTGIALAFFLLGVAGILFGVRLVVKSGKTSS